MIIKTKNLTKQCQNEVNPLDWIKMIRTIMNFKRSNNHEIKEFGRLPILIVSSIGVDFENKV